MQLSCSFLFAGQPSEKFARKRLDSGSVHQRRMCHAQITESCAYHGSETQAAYFHRGSRCGRRGDPHPHLSSHSRSNQLFPWAATCVRLGFHTVGAEQRKPHRLSASRDRSAWIKEQEVRVDGNRIVEYQVIMKVSFV